MGGIRKMGEKKRKGKEKKKEKSDDQRIFFSSPKKIQEKEGEMWKVDVIMFSSSFI